MQWRKFTRFKSNSGGYSRTRRMLCCGRRKENGRSVPDLTASPGRQPGPMPSNMSLNQSNTIPQRHANSASGGVKEPVLLQGDFRKVSGISSEIFRQIEAVENDHDSSTAGALEAVERRGEMIVRMLEPRCIGRHSVEAAQKFLAKGDARHTVQLVEIVKRPGQTLGLYIREGNGGDRSDGVFISRIAIESAVYNSGCLRVGDEILAVNLVDVTRMSLDDVVIIMSIPRRLVLAIRQRRSGRGSNSPGPPMITRPEQKPPPVVVIKRGDLRDDEMDLIDSERSIRSNRSSRERRTGDGREMTESRSRLGLGLNNYSPQSEQLEMYYSSRTGQPMDQNWGYKPPPPPPQSSSQISAAHQHHPHHHGLSGSSVITEQPKFAPSHAYYQNAGTLESLAEKVHPFFPSPSDMGYHSSTPTNRRMSAGGIAGGMGYSQSHQRFPRSGSDQHLPRVEYSDFASLGRHSLLRSSLKTGAAPPPGVVGGTLGRYGRYDSPQSRQKYAQMANAPANAMATRRSRPNLDYSSDTEATISPRPNYYYYNRPAVPQQLTASRTSATHGLGGVLATDLTKFNSLPRDRPGASRLGLRPRLGDRLTDESDLLMADLRSRMTASPSIFTSDEYRAWLRRAPSSSAISEQMRVNRDILNQRVGRFSCSAENIHDALKNTEHLYSGRTGFNAGTLDRNMMGPRNALTGAPVRSLSTQHLGSNSIRSPSMRRMRQLLELGAPGPGSPGASSIMSGHQSPAPTPSATLPRTHRTIDINPAEFVKYKLDKPILDLGGVSGMLWIHLLAGRGLRSAPENTAQSAQPMSRDLYCVLECDRVHKARTVVRSGDLQFDWDESFELDLVSNKQLDVLVYSWDPQHRHKLCYRGAISLSTLLRQSPLHQIALKVEPRGTIYLRFRHTDPMTLYRRRGLPSLRASYPQLFGADLETVVTREAKGAPGSGPVPIVLRRCVEEVERRGLDIIGLYRLCGSATKKRLLREAFERNSRAVELSPEHVPDINVITGVLKDYLRELPEPLFTRCLFQMTVDALAVCLPDDPEGNSKLMLSILDCLPRANRATLVFLLDHLSLVVSASERNKMSAQALATVMGPPLMLHSVASNAAAEELDHSQPIAVLKYLLQIWPHPTQPESSGALYSTQGKALQPGLQTNSLSGRRGGELIGPRGSKVSPSPAGRPPSRAGTVSLAVSEPVTAPAVSSRSTEVTARSATARSRPSPSAADPSAVSHRVSPPAESQPRPSSSRAAVSASGQLSEGSAASETPDRSRPHGTPSPTASSSNSTASGSGTTEDTIKRGASPAMSSSGASTVRQLNESGSSYSMNTSKNNGHSSAVVTNGNGDYSSSTTADTSHSRSSYLLSRSGDSSTSSSLGFYKKPLNGDTSTSTSSYSFTPTSNSYSYKSSSLDTTNQDSATSSLSKSPTTARKTTIGGVNVSLFENSVPPTVEAKPIFKDFKYYGGNLTTSTYTPAIISPSSSSLSTSSSSAATTTTSPSKTKPLNSYATLPKSSANTSSSFSSSSPFSPSPSSISSHHLHFNTTSHTTAHATSGSSGFYSSTSTASSKEEPSYRVPYSSTNPFLPTFNPTTTSATSAAASPATATTTTNGKGYYD